MIEKRFAEAKRLTGQIDERQLPPVMRTLLPYLKARIAFELNDFVGGAGILDQAPPVERFVPSEWAEGYRLRAQAKEYQGKLREVLDLYWKAIDSAEATSSGGSALSFQALAGDRTFELFESAIPIAWRLRTVDRRVDRELVDLVLRATTPSVPIAKTPLNRPLELALAGLSAQRLMELHNPQFRKEHPTIDASDDRLRESFRSALELRSRGHGRQVRFYYLGQRFGLCLVWQDGRLMGAHRFSSEQLREISRGIESWRDSIIQFEDLQPDALVVARRLTELLFPEGWPNTTPAIEIMAHASLWRLPFETLVTSAPGSPIRYLDEDRSISYVTPITLLRNTAMASSKQVTQAANAGSGYFSCIRK